jgi:hypothetical protein
MSDQETPETPPAAAPARPKLGAGGPAKGPRPAGARPAFQQPGPSPASLRLRARLMLFILVTCVALVGLIGWRIYKKMHAGERVEINVQKDYEEAVDKGKDASKEILKLQAKVWDKNEELKPEDYTTIKAKLVELREAHEKLKDLLDIMHVRGLDDSAERAAIVPKWLQMKMWILDATDLVENQKPPEYGGLNIPMFLTSKKITKSQDELKELNTLKDEIIKRNDPAEIKATRKKLQDLRDTFRGLAAKMQDLDKYVAEGLARPDLTSKDVIELEMLRGDANQAQMAVVAAGKILQAFPE